VFKLSFYIKHVRHYSTYHPSKCLISPLVTPTSVLHLGDINKQKYNHRQHSPFEVFFISSFQTTWIFNPVRFALLSTPMAKPEPVAINAIKLEKTPIKRTKVPYNPRKRAMRMPDYELDEVDERRLGSAINTTP